MSCTVSVSYSTKIRSVIGTLHQSGYLIYNNDQTHQGHELERSWSSDQRSSLSDVKKARTLKAKAKAIPAVQRLTMKYEVTRSCFFEYSYKATSSQHSNLITSLITDMLRKNKYRITLLLKVQTASAVTNFVHIIVGIKCN